MFDSITFQFNRMGKGGPDLGMMAESLIFYRKVIVVGNTSNLKDLLTGMTSLVVLELMRRKKLEIHFLEDHLAVSSQKQQDGRTSLGFLLFSSPQHTSEIDVPKIFLESSETSNNLGVLSKEFESLVSTASHEGFDLDAMAMDFTDPCIIEPCVEAVLRMTIPDTYLPARIRFRLDRERVGYFVDSNLDFSQILKACPDHHEIATPENLLSIIQSSYEQLYFAGELGSELASDEVEASIHSTRINSVFVKSQESQKQLSCFSEFVLDDSRSIRDAINSRRVAFSSILEILDNVEKFRSWIDGLNANSDLVKAYFQEVTKDTWVSSLPVKLLRWALFTYVGVKLDPATGVGIGAFDAFFLDKLIVGWKPNSFIDENLRPVFGIDQISSKNP